MVDMKPHLIASFLLACCTAVAAQDAPSATIESMCGSKDLVVALTDGFGGNTYRLIQAAEFRDEAKKCANIKDTIYMDASGDAQKYNNDINSLAAQGVNVIITFADFGDAAIPAYRSAIRQGVTVVPYFAKLSGEAGRDFSANVYSDQAAVAQQWADWIGANFKDANVLFLGGIPGASSSQSLLDNFKVAVAQYPGVKLLQEDFVVTNWAAADAQKAVAGAIARYPKIDVVIADFGVTGSATVRAFKQAGVPVPAIVAYASNNELNCQYVDDMRAGNAWPYYSIDGLTQIVRFALRRGVSLAAGTANADSDLIVSRPYADHFAGLTPTCDHDAPPDADLSSALSPEDLKAIFSK